MTETPRPPGRGNVLAFGPRRNPLRSGAPRRRESEIQHAVMVWCAMNRLVCLRMNTGSFSGEYKGKRRFIRFGVKGMADLLLVLPLGRAAFVEVKGSSGKLTRDQQWFLDAMERQGALTAVVRSPEDLADILLAHGYQVVR
jgi:hypothetical protein